MDSIIVGGGPAGSYLAKKIAKKGMDVLVIDEKKRIGTPIQCTGLFTKEIENYVNLKDSITNKIKYVVLHSKANKVRLKSKEYVVNRERFDNILKEEAESVGAKYILGSRLKSYSKKDGLIFTKRKIQTKILVGADGPNSTVDRLFRMNKNKEFFFAKQYVIKTKVEEIDTYHAYFGERFDGFFGWIVPCGERCLRIGTGSKDPTRVNLMLKMFLRENKINGKIVETNAGLIPIYNPDSTIYKKYNNMSIYLVGDAGGFVKATSGGGVVQLIKMIEEASDYVVREERPIIPKTRLELLSHLVLHYLMEDLSDNELDSYIEMISQHRKIFQKTTRDSMFKLALNILVKKPSIVAKVIKTLL